MKIPVYQDGKIVFQDEGEQDGFHFGREHIQPQSMSMSNYLYHDANDSISSKLASIINTLKVQSYYAQVQSQAIESVQKTAAAMENPGLKLGLTKQADKQIVTDSKVAQDAQLEDNANPGLKLGLEKQADLDVNPGLKLGLEKQAEKIDAAKTVVMKSPSQNGNEQKDAGAHLVLNQTITDTADSMTARTMQFQFNDAGTNGSADPAVWMKVTELSDGKLQFDVTQSGDTVGDLRGIFFDLADESLLNSLNVTSAATAVVMGNDTIKDLGNGANMQGMTGTDKGYDVGIKIGSAGLGADDVRAFSFVLDSSARPLTLEDVSNVDFGARLTSVGEVDGARDASAKLYEGTFAVVDAKDDAATVYEDARVTGDLLGNDAHNVSPNDVMSISQFSGGELGEVYALENAAGATLQVNADGSFVIDMTQADALSEGESFTYNFKYSAMNQNDATSFGQDDAYFTVTVEGKNDGPTAIADLAEINEKDMLVGNVMGNDFDIDRLDTLAVTAINGQEAGIANEFKLDSGASVFLNSDGSFVYQTNGVFDALNAGEQAMDGFEYTIADGKGGFDTARVDITINGVGDGGPVLKDYFPTMSQALSNVVLYLDDGDKNTDILKVKLDASGQDIYDIDYLYIDHFIEQYAQTQLQGNTQLIGLSIHAGQEFPTNDAMDNTAPGEGAFFYLLDDDPSVTAIGSKGGKGGWTQDWTKDDAPLSQQAKDSGLTDSLLKDQAKIVFDNFDAKSGEWLL